MLKFFSVLGILWISGSALADSEIPSKKDRPTFRHALELQGLANGLAYRIRNDEHSLTTGFSYIAKDRKEVFTKYQCRVLTFPLEAVLWGQEKEEGNASIEHFGHVRVTSTTAALGLGAWMNFKLFEQYSDHIYIPISAGIMQTVHRKSRFESEAVDDFSTVNKNKRFLYVNFGVGYEF